MLRVENICKTFFAGTINEKKSSAGFIAAFETG